MMTKCFKIRLQVRVLGTNGPLSFRITVCFNFPSRTEDRTLNDTDLVLVGVHVSSVLF